MLVLTRKEGDFVTVEIPGQKPIRVTLVSVKGKQVRVGIEAPQEYRILRDNAVKLKN